MDIPTEMLAASDVLSQTLAKLSPVLPGVVAIDIGLREEGFELTDELVIWVW